MTAEIIIGAAALIGVAALFAFRRDEDEPETWFDVPPEELVRHLEKGDK